MGPATLLSDYAEMAQAASRRHSASTSLSRPSKACHSKKVIVPPQADVAADDQRINQGYEYTDCSFSKTSL